MNSFKTNIHSLAAFFALLISLVLTVKGEWNANDLLKREHSLIKPYGGSSSGIPHWDFIGSTIVTNKFIRLTADSQSLQGALWNTVPIEMPDWEMQVQFSVHGHGKDLFGDGFAIWYTKDRNQMGPVFGSKDFFSGLAIFMDTYNNNNGPHNRVYPFISAMVNNGSLHYDNDKDGSPTQLAGCESQFRNKEYDTFVAIRYQNYKLTVSTDTENKNTWKECFSVENVKLPTRYYLGFSALTGDLSDNHDIIGVKVYKLDSPRTNEKLDPSLIVPGAESFTAHSDNETVESSSTAWYVIKVMFISILVIGLLVVVLIFGYKFYEKQSRTKKRFY